MYGLIETLGCRGLLTGDTCGGEHSVGLEAMSSRLEAERWRRRRSLQFCRNLRAPPTICSEEPHPKSVTKALKSFTVTHLRKNLPLACSARSFPEHRA